MTDVNELLSKLKDENISYFERRDVVRALGELGDKRAVPPLLDALVDEERFVRREAAIALGKLEDVRAVEALIEALKDEDYRTRQNAAAALGELGDVRAIEPLRQAINDVFVYVRGVAKESIEKIEAKQRAISERCSGVEPPNNVAETSEEPVEAVTEEAEEEQATEEVEEQQPLSPEEATVSRPIETPISPTHLARVLSERNVGERMQIFFMDALGEVEATYRQLWEQEGRLPTLEAQLKDVSMKLSFERADKDDDIQEYDESIERTERNLSALKRERDDVSEQKSALEIKLTSRWHNMIAFILRRKAKEQARLTLLSTKLTELEEDIAETEHQLADYRKNYSDLLGPIDRLQEELEELETSKKECEETIGNLNSEIISAVQDVILSTPLDQLSNRLNSLAPLTSDADFFRNCVAQLRTLLMERGEISDKLESARQEREAKQSKAHESLAQVGRTISEGFHTRSSSRTTNARLSGSVRFEEERGLLGWSGVSGSAAGSGSGNASYAVDEIAWKPAGELSERVSQFAENWSALGVTIGDVELHSAELNACERGIQEYAHFIRAELERDFIERGNAKVER